MVWASPTSVTSYPRVKAPCRVDRTHASVCAPVTTRLPTARSARTDSRSVASNDGQPGDETSKLGLAVRPLTQQEKRQAETDGDLLIEDVDGPAAVAGVRPGDIILGVNGAKVKSMDELRAAAKKRNGKVVALLIERDNAQIFVPVRVG